MDRVAELVSRDQLDPRHRQDLERVGRKCSEALNALEASIKKHLVLQETRNRPEKRFERLKQHFKIDWHRLQLEPEVTRR